MDERSVFLEALEQLSPAQRSAYLREACGGDAALRQRVEALLSSHEQAGSFLAKPVPLEVLGTVLDHVAVFARPPDATPRERRLAGRLPVTLPLRVTAELGGVATGAVIEVSATGLRARLDRPLEPGTAARLSIALPDGGAPVDALALVVRSDTDRTVAFWFLDLTPAEVERLLARAQARTGR